jgi:hypothetical protein
MEWLVDFTEYPCLSFIRQALDSPRDRVALYMSHVIRRDSWNGSWEGMPVVLTPKFGWRKIEVGSDYEVVL